MKVLFDPDVRATLEARVRALGPDSQRKWGKMSPHQAICHLSDAFRFALGEKAAAARTNVFSPMMRVVALYLPLQWPHGVKTMPEVEQGIGGTPPADFERDKAELLALIERFCANRDQERWPDHPMFGRMSTQDWSSWGYRHLDHHLRQFGQ